MQTDRMRHYAKLDNEKRELESKVKSIKSEMQELEAQILEEMADEELDKVTVNIAPKGEPPDKRTIFPRRELWAGYKEDKGKLIEALKSSGLDHMVNETFNTQTLSAWVREFDDGKSTDEIIAQLPSQVQEYIKVSEKHQVRTCKAE